MWMVVANTRNLPIRFDPIVQWLSLCQVIPKTHVRCSTCLRGRRKTVHLFAPSSERCIVVPLENDERNRSAQSTENDKIKTFEQERKKKKNEKKEKKSIVFFFLSNEKKKRSLLVRTKNNLDRRERDSHTIQIPFHRR
jgi:protease II